jgi:hypothetical protein
VVGKSWKFAIQTSDGGVLLNLLHYLLEYSTHLSSNEGTFFQIFKNPPQTPV